MNLPDRATLLRLVRWVVGLAMAWSVVVLGAMVAWGGDDLWQRLGAIGVPLALATAVLFAANHLLRFLRWHLLLRAEGHRIAWRRSLSIFLAGLALLPTPAKAGVAARSVLLLPEGVPVHVSLAAWFAERLTDLLGLVILASLLWTGAGPEGRWLLALAVAVAGMLLVWAAPAICAGMQARLGRWPAAARALEWLRRFFVDAAEMLSGWRLPAFVAIGIAANVATGILLWYALASTPVALEAAHAVGVLAVSHLSGSISMLPGGLGGFELAMLAQLAAAGVTAADALTALLLVRIATLWGSVALGLPLLWAGMRREAGGAGRRIECAP